MALLRAPARPIRNLCSDKRYPRPCDAGTGGDAMVRKAWMTPDVPDVFDTPADARAEHPIMPCAYGRRPASTNEAYSDFETVMSGASSFFMPWT